MDEPISDSDIPSLGREWMERIVDERATDLHLDTVSTGYRIALRVDGLLRPGKHLDDRTGHKLLNQWKVAADLDLDQHRRPLHGRLAFQYRGEPHAFRITVIPTLNGESAHLRRLRAAEEILSPTDLGLHPRDLESLEEILKRPEGLILASGPTGSGKTMTVYSLLAQLNHDSLLAATIEDPVEYNLPRVRQIQVDEEHGLGFSTGLETLLRMDPDVLVIGEIRDRASAETAIRAAAAGRFVLASLHSPDVAGIIDSLSMLGINSRRLSTVLRFACAQKLYRTLCDECASQSEIRPEEAEWFEQEGIEPPENLARPEGCSTCNGTGYRGRRGAFESLIPNPELISLIATRGNATALREKLRALENPTLLRAGLEAAAEGRTSFEEAVSLHHPPGLSALEEE